MKRILSLVIFCFALSSALHAQLPRNFFGATLGVTNKHQAIKAILAQKVCIATNTEDGLYLKDVVFEGHHFDYINMVFYDDILYKVYISDNDEGYNDKVESISDKYTTKYPQYKYHFIDNGALFDDDVTEITFHDSFIHFQDMKLAIREAQDLVKYDREIHPYTQPRISLSVLGCTLGTSTKQQVTAALKAKGLDVLPFNSQDGSISVAFSGTYFEGVDFDYILAVFTDGKLANMMFIRFDGNEMSDSEYKRLEQNLNSDYSAYNKTRLLGLSDEEGISFDDDRISIAFGRMGLSYKHKELGAKEDRRQKRNLRGK